jgi:hypothetical protein
MKRVLYIAALAGFAAALGAPAFAGSYPVTGRWGQSTSTEKGPIDCSKLRVISFSGNQRTDSNGGVPAYRNRTVQSIGAGLYRVEDEFTTGQIANAHVNYTLRMVDTETLEMNQAKGGPLKLRKCK